MFSCASCYLYDALADLEFVTPTGKMIHKRWPSRKGFRRNRLWLHGDTFPASSWVEWGTAQQFSVKSLWCSWHSNWASDESKYNSVTGTPTCLLQKTVLRMNWYEWESILQKVAQWKWHEKRKGNDRGKRLEVKRVRQISEVNKESVRKRMVCSRINVSERINMKRVIVSVLALRG